jgi:hypothetical protein
MNLEKSEGYRVKQALSQQTYNRQKELEKLRLKETSPSSKTNQK